MGLKGFNLPNLNDIPSILLFKKQKIIPKSSDVSEAPNSILEASNPIFEHEARKNVQPFHTNDLLRSLIKSQTPKWVNIAMLILTIAILSLTIFQILHSYAIF